MRRHVRCAGRAAKERAIAEIRPVAAALSRAGGAVAGCRHAAERDCVGRRKAAVDGHAHSCRACSPHAESELTVAPSHRLLTNAVHLRWWPDVCRMPQMLHDNASRTMRCRGSKRCASIPSLGKPRELQLETVPIHAESNLRHSHFKEKSNSKYLDVSRKRRRGRANLQLEFLSCAPPPAPMPQNYNASCRPLGAAISSSGMTLQKISEGR